MGNVFARFSAPACEKQWALKSASPLEAVTTLETDFLSERSSEKSAA